MENAVTLNVVERYGNPDGSIDFCHTEGLGLAWVEQKVLDCNRQAIAHPEYIEVQRWHNDLANRMDLVVAYRWDMDLRRFVEVTAEVVAANA